jgi:hypothetical protein
MAPVVLSRLNPACRLSAVRAQINAPIAESLEDGHADEGIQPVANRAVPLPLSFPANSFSVGGASLLRFRYFGGTIGSKQREMAIS